MALRVPPDFGLAVEAEVGAIEAEVGATTTAVGGALVGCAAGAVVGAAGGWAIGAVVGPAAPVVPGRAWHAASKVVAAPAPTSLRNPLRLLNLCMAAYSSPLSGQSPSAG